jgi:intracellular sulfur oxidation DsrE/DsrF family protein
MVKKNYRRIVCLAYVTVFLMTCGSLTMAEEMDVVRKQEIPNHTDSSKLFPKIKGIGGVFRVDQAPKIAVNEAQKLVLDITSFDPKERIHEGLEHAARALNLYALAGVPDEKVSIALVIHGKATSITLNDETYSRKFNTPNPNSDLLRLLSDNGVSILICGQALHHHGFSPDDVDASVKVTLSAMTALVELQHAGYALFPDSTPDISMW